MARLQLRGGDWLRLFLFVLVVLAIAANIVVSIISNLRIAAIWDSR